MGVKDTYRLEKLFQKILSLTFFLSLSVSLRFECLPQSRSLLLKSKLKKSEAADDPGAAVNFS